MEEKMASESFLDPRDTIDRRAEQELFAGLVSFATPARMLVISDKIDRGKSTLLRRLQYNCKYEINPPAHVPACLVDLGEDNLLTAFDLIAKIVEGLNINDRFPKFTPLNIARTSKKIDPFDAVYKGMPGYANVGGDFIGRGKVVHGDDVRGDKIGGNKYEYNMQREFTEGHETIARKKCIEAFFEDLRVLCATQPVVILLDHWENCNYDLREWIKGTFMREHFLNRDKNLRPAKLAIVVAGNSYDKAKAKFGIRDDEFDRLFNNEQECKETILSIRSVCDWDSKHVREFLEQHGYYQVSDEDIDMLRDCLKRRHTLGTILAIYNEMYSRNYNTKQNSDS
jgi:hypothetical protein